MGNLDPDQREHELVEALVTLLIAVSRYGADDKHARPTANRLVVITEIAALLANRVAERAAAIDGKSAAKALRSAPGRRQP
jgi:hypothetical protein